MNHFVDYLNSTNNVGGDSTGSLAESQVKSPYFDKVKIDRKLGSYIASSIKSKRYETFILTGHAGDGKTSILVQVLRSLGYLPPKEGLSQEGNYLDFYYVKDMSEINEELQTGILRRALSAPTHHQSSLLISNTGPLINTFMRLAKEIATEKNLQFGENDEILLQSRLLKQLDLNTDEPIEFEGFNFHLINIARVDNVSFATKIFERIIDAELWSECSQCSHAKECPIYNNINLVSQYFSPVSSFIENFYRYLFENDKRMTIRQIVSQISFAITGNLSCEQVQSAPLKMPAFNYNFANLFFGYRGIDDAPNSIQIKGISQIRMLGLDSITLDVDYEVFVNHDYSRFPSGIQAVLDSVSTAHKKHYQSSDEAKAIDASNKNFEAQLRRSFRRFYLVFGNDKPKDKNVFDQIYGENFTLYQKLISHKQPKPMLRNVQTLLFKALFMKNTGFLPGNANDLPLTLTRADNTFQNVMLVLGKVPRSDLNIRQLPMLNKFEDMDSKQQLVLSVKKEDFIITLPMLNYFENLVRGAIASNHNPALSHGIAKLDTLLLTTFGDQMPDCKEDCELTVLINTANGQETRTYTFDGQRLWILS